MGVAVRTGRLPVEFSSQRSVVYAYVAEIELLDSKGIGRDVGFAQVYYDSSVPIPKKWMCCASKVSSQVLQLHLIILSC